MPERFEPVAPRGYVLRHVSSIRVTGEPYAGDGKFFRCILPKTADMISWVKGRFFNDRIEIVSQLMRVLRSRAVALSQKNKDDKANLWRDAVSRACRNAEPWDYQMRGPIVCEATFLMPRPKRLGEGARVPYARVQFRDLDNLMKPVQDGGTESGIYEDDGQIYELHASKWYAATGEDAGLELEFWELSERPERGLFDDLDVAPRRRRVSN